MWEIKSSRLIAGLKLLDLIPEKVGLSSSEFFRITGNKDKVTFAVASYIMGEITVTGDGEWPKGSLYIDRRVFLPFIYASKEIKNKNKFRFTFKKNVLTVQHGTRKAEFGSQKDVQGYGDLRKILREKEHKLKVSKDLQQLLKCGQNCAVSDAVVPSLNCVYVSKDSGTINAYAASDKVFYLGLSQNKESSIKASIPFPLFMISLLTESSLVSIAWRGKFILFKFDKGIIWQSISEEALKKFPLKEIKSHAKKANTLPITFVTSSRRLSKLMVRLGFYLQAVRRKDWAVKLEGAKGGIELIVSTSIPGVKFNEKISVSKPLPHEVKVEWPLDCLEPVFAFFTSKTKKEGLVVRIDKKHGVSYLTAGSYWLAVTSRKKD